VFSDGAGGGRPEIGLLPFARVARDVARRILPPTRSRFSKHQFTQPQLLAILCLMRYEDGTFREAQVRLGEHRELREILQLRSVPHYTTLYRFLRRLDDETITRGVGETVRRLRRGKKQVRVSAAVEGTGLSYNAVSTFFIRRIEQHSRGMTCHRHWLKWLVIADVKQQILLAQRDKDRGALREHCLLCSTPPGNGCLCARCWPMPSSIPKLITNISGSAGEPVASFPPNRAAASREGQFVIRCTGLFRKKSTDNEPRSKPSSR
jgi:hypothetical protein